MLRDLVGYQLRRASVFDLQGAVQAIEPLGFRPVQLSVLCVIVETPGISAAAICRELGIQRANIVSMLADLEGRGLTLRETDDSDSRVRRLFATGRGEELARQAIGRLEEHDARLLSRLQPEERHELRRLLEKVWKTEDED